jgi:O-antigen/teichoic acid export membrane protein
MGAGFLFWVIAAKIYSIDDVGKGTALLSSLGLIILISRLGFDFSLIRFISGYDRDEVLNTCLGITILSTTIICLSYITIDSLLPTPLVSDITSALIFTAAAVFNSVSLVTGNMFLAIRNPHHFFTQNAITSSRLVLLFPLVYLKAFGIFLSMGISHLLASAFGIVLLKIKGFKLNVLAVNKKFIKKSLKFSLGNCLSNNLYEAPGLILPIMVLHMLGEGAAAKYYIAFMLGNLAIIIPMALSMALFVEGSHQQPLKQNLIKTISAAYLSLLPCAVILFFLGKYILGFINQDYVEAFNLLRLVVLANFFDVLLLIYVSVQNVRMRVKDNVKTNLLRFVLILGLSYTFIQKININGVGYAFLVTYAVLTLIIMAQSWREKPFSIKDPGENQEFAGSTRQSFEEPVKTTNLEE